MRDCEWSLTALYPPFLAHIPATITLCPFDSCGPDNEVNQRRQCKADFFRNPLPLACQSLWISVQCHCVRFGKFGFPYCAFIAIRVFALRPQDCLKTNKSAIDYSIKPFYNWKLSIKSWSLSEGWSSSIFRYLWHDLEGYWE